jgi:protein-tyrosine phosphatase
VALPVRAVSAGLAPQCFSRNPGPISPHTRAALRTRGIEVTDPRAPCDANEELFARASLIVAVKELEHRPMMLARFPDWAGRVRYWNVDDLPLVQAADALASLEVLVRALVVELGDTTR